MLITWLNSKKFSKVNVLIKTFPVEASLSDLKKKFQKEILINENNILFFKSVVYSDLTCILNNLEIL